MGGDSDSLRHLQDGNGSGDGSGDGSGEGSGLESDPLDAQEGSGE